MKALHTYPRYPALIVLLLFLAACSQGANHAAKSATITTLDVCKSIDCPRCQHWNT